MQSADARSLPWLSTTDQRKMAACGVGRWQAQTLALCYDRELSDGGAARFRLAVKPPCLRQALPGDMNEIALLGSRTSCLLQHPKPRNS
jgi:hypothetical protein